MASFSTLGGVLQALQSGVSDEDIIATMLACKPPLDVLHLATTADQMRLSKLVDLSVAALFDTSRSKADFQRSIGVDDDLYNLHLPDANRDSKPLAELEALPARSTLEHLTYNQLEFACSICQRLRGWAWSEMERRVQRVLAGEDVLARDPSMRQGSCAGLWRAIELVEGRDVPQLEREVAEFLGDERTELDLSGTQMGEPGWNGILQKVAALSALVTLDLRDCGIPWACYSQLQAVFQACSCLKEVFTDRAGDDGEAEGWPFACWRLHKEGLDGDSKLAHKQVEIFLLNVRLPATGPFGWRESVFNRLTGSRKLTRLNLTMCHIPRQCELGLQMLLESCPRLQKVDTVFAGDDDVEYGWVDRLWNSVRNAGSDVRVPLRGSPHSPSKLHRSLKMQDSKASPEAVVKSWRADPNGSALALLRARQAELDGTARSSNTKGLDGASPTMKVVMSS